MGDTLHRWNEIWHRGVEVIVRTNTLTNRRRRKHPPRFATLRQRVISLGPTSGARMKFTLYWPAWEMHCNNYLRLVLGLGLIRVSYWVRVRITIRIRVKVRVSVMVRVSIRTSWVVNFALFRCYRPVIYTRPWVPISQHASAHSRRRHLPFLPCGRCA